MILILGSTADLWAYRMHREIRRDLRRNTGGDAKVLLDNLVLSLWPVPADPFLRLAEDDE